MFTKNENKNNWFMIGILIIASFFVLVIAYSVYSSVNSQNKKDNLMKAKLIDECFTKYKDELINNCKEFMKGFDTDKCNNKTFEGALQRAKEDCSKKYY